MITYQRGSLFDAPDGALLAHACNCRGVWGSGIAAQFATVYPEYLRFYQSECMQYGPKLLGTAVVLAGEKHKLANLFTSDGFGADVMAPEVVVKNTEAALEDLFKQTYVREKEVHMPKINSGRFKVPWEMTEEVLVRVAEKFGREFVVWEP